MRKHNPIILKTIYVSFIYLFLYLPIAVIVIFSFNNAARSLLWHGFTLDWYRELFHDSAMFMVALHSLIIGFLAATIATLLGLVAAVTLYRYRFLGRKAIDGLLYALVVSPEIVMGIALLILFSTIKLPLGFWSLLLAHIAFCIPFVAVTINARIVALDRNIFAAAKDLGANDFTIFHKIIIPLLLPAIVAGWLLSFTLSLDDVIISYFVSGPKYEILPLKIYSMVRIGVKPEVNALCTIMLGLTLLAAIVYQWALMRKK
jgi:spermidine/putrescine transport system permease protein